MEMSWLSRAITWITCSVIFLAMSQFSLSFWKYPWVFVASVSLPVLLEWTHCIMSGFVFYVLYSMQLFCCPSAQWSYCRCCMSPLDWFCFLIKNISTLQTFYPHVCWSNTAHVSAFCHKLGSNIKIIQFGFMLRSTSSWCRQKIYYLSVISWWQQ